MKIIINSDCVTCGLCAEIAPEIFRMNDQIDIAEVIRNPESEAEITLAIEAIASCPENAIIKAE